MKRQRFYISLFILSMLMTLCSLHSQQLTNWWESHPLWVGYQATGNGRNPAISGIIDKNYIAQFISIPNPIIVEAGAYNGLDTVEMAHRWPGAIIHAFEPMPSAFNALNLNCVNLPNVRLYPFALSDKPGIQTLYISSGASDGSSSLLPPGSAMDVYHPDINFSQAIDVWSTTLDSWAAYENLSHIDFLWLDLQGVEPVVLQASPNIFKTVNIVFTEVNLAPTYEGAILYPEFKAWMESQGFITVREDIPWVDGGNVLFVKLSYLNKLLGY
jgi:FkbM family methyltransferase